MKTLISGIIVALVILGGAWAIVGTNKPTDAPLVNNVKMEGEKQIVEITAKGGYLPRKSTAKAGIPTVLRMNTKGTFDCSSVMRIPALNISKNLPPSGMTDIELGVQEAGILAGTCGMGMYPFEIVFEG